MMRHGIIMAWYDREDEYLCQSNRGKAIHTEANCCAPRRTRGGFLFFGLLCSNAPSDDSMFGSSFQLVVVAL